MDKSLIGKKIPNKLTMPSLFDTWACDFCILKKQLTDTDNENPINKYLIFTSNNAESHYPWRGNLSLIVRMNVERHKWHV